MKKNVFIALILMLMFFTRPVSVYGLDDAKGMQTIVSGDFTPVEGEDWVLMIHCLGNITGWEIWFGPKIVAGPAEDPHPAGDKFIVKIWAEYMTAGEKEVRVIIHSSPNDVIFFTINIQHVLTAFESVMSFGFLVFFVLIVLLIRNDYLRWEEKQWTKLPFKKYLISRVMYISLLVLFLFIAWFLTNLLGIDYWRL